MKKWLTQTLTPILCGLALLLAVIALGRAARASLDKRTEYLVGFRDIECQPPQGMARSAFLDEVQSLAHQPQSLRLLDDNLLARLRRAFAAHPGVESVRSVQIVPGDRRRAALRVELTYRQPVLTLRPTHTDAANRKRDNLMSARTVDRCGSLLPASVSHGCLPVLSVDTPSGVGGNRWHDPRVSAAAATVAFLKPHLKRLGLEDCEVEIVGKEIVFHKPGVRIVWGHAPGHEEKGEAPAEVKLRRLLEYQAKHEGLTSLEHDVRLIAYQGHFPLTLDAGP